MVKCKKCGHVFFKHKYDEDDGKEIRTRWKVKNCECEEYQPMNKNDHRHTW